MPSPLVLPGFEDVQIDFFDKSDSSQLNKQSQATQSHICEFSVFEPKKGVLE